MMGAYFKNQDGMALLFADRPNFFRVAEGNPSVTAVKYSTSTAKGPRANTGEWVSGAYAEWDVGVAFDVKYIEWTAEVILPYNPLAGVLPVFRISGNAPYHFKYYGGAAITSWYVIDNVVTVKGVFSLWSFYRDYWFNGLDFVSGTADDDHVKFVSNMMDTPFSASWYQPWFDALTESNVKQFLEVAVYGEYDESIRHAPLGDMGVRIQSQTPYFDSRTDKSLLRVGAIGDFSNGPQKIDLDNPNYMPKPRLEAGSILATDWVHHTVGTFVTKHYDPKWRLTIHINHNSILGNTLYSTHQEKSVGGIVLATVLAGNHWAAGFTFLLDRFTYINQYETKDGVIADLGGITGIQFTGEGGNTTISSGWPINAEIGGNSAYTYYFRD